MLEERYGLRLQAGSVLAHTAASTASVCLQIISKHRRPAHRDNHKLESLDESPGRLLAIRMSLTHLSRPRWAELLFSIHLKT